MMPVSARWESTATMSHDVASRVEVWRGDQMLIADLPIIGGQVTRDFGSVNTLDAEVTLGDPALLPTDIDSPLAPFGSELRIFSGIRYPDRQVELVQIFSGPIVSTPTWPSRDSFSIQADGWLRYVSDDRFLAPYAPAPGTDVQSEIVRLLRESVPGAPVDIDAGLPVRTTSEGLLWEEDRLQAVLDLAEALGAVVRENPTGKFCIEVDQPPSAAATPVRSYVHGANNAMLAYSDVAYTREERYNGVVAYNGDDQSIRGLATFDDAAVPTHWGGPFGRKVLYYASPMLDAGNVQAAAQTRLDNLKGRTRKIDVEILPDPSIEPGDHIRLEWQVAYGPSSTESRSEMAQVRKVVNRLGPGTTALETRGVG